MVEKKKIQNNNLKKNTKFSLVTIYTLGSICRFY